MRLRWKLAGAWGFERMKGLGLALLALWLAACSSTPLAPPAQGFAASGRVNIRQAERADTVQFVWQASAERDTLALNTPLGNTLAELRLRYERDMVVEAELDRGTERRTARDPEALLLELTGVQLPVSGMRWWLRGLPAPTAAFSREGDTLVQAGWRISPSDYRGGQWPYRIELQRLDSAQDAIKIRVLINEWQQASVAAQP